MFLKAYMVKRLTTFGLLYVFNSVVIYNRKPKLL